MPVTTQAVAATPDNPAIVSASVLENAAVGGRWTAGGTMTEADLTDGSSIYPVSNVFDRFLHMASQPTISATLWYLNLRVRNVSPGGDVLMIAGHNLVGSSVRLETADNDAFSVGLQTIYDFGVVVAAGRLIAVLGTNWRTMDRCRVRISNAGGILPQISEVFFGTRFVLTRAPNLPWDGAALAGDVDQTRTKGGIITNYGRALGYRKANLKYHTGNSVEHAAIRQAFADTNYGKFPFLLIDNPNTVPGTGYWMDWSSKEIMLELFDGPAERVLQLPMIECAPLVSQGG